MQNTFTCIFTLLFVLLQAKSNDEIIGKWELVQATGGGPGITLVFNRDGSLIITPGIFFGGTYRLKGRHLIKTSQSDGTKSTETQEIEIQGDTLIETSNWKKETLIRLTPRDFNSSPIVGKWGRQILYEFRRDGTLIVEPEYMSDRSYKLDGRHLIINGRESKSKKTFTEAGEIQIERDSLIWKTSDGRVIQMRRLTAVEPDSLPIVGRWIVQRFGTDNIYVTEYKKNGEWTYSSPLKDDKLWYTIKGDLLTATLEKWTQIIRFRFENGLLVLKLLPNEQFSENKFQRVE